MAAEEVVEVGRGLNVYTLTPGPTRKPTRDTVSNTIGNGPDPEVTQARQAAFNAWCARYHDNGNTLVNINQKEIEPWCDNGCSPLLFAVSRSTRGLGVGWRYPPSTFDATTAGCH